MLMSLADTSIRDLLSAFSSSDPTPGGGSASALASAVGASLLLMVAGLPKSRTGSEEGRTALASASALLVDIRRQLTTAIDADAEAYDEVVRSYKLPKSTAERRAAIQAGLRAATDVPLAVMHLSVGALTQAERVAAHGHQAAASDVGIAVGLLRAGVRGAKLNVDINLGSISDAAYTEAARSEADRLSKEAERMAMTADARLGSV